MLNEPVSCFKLVPDNHAISLARQYLLKFILPILDDKVEMYNGVTLSIAYH